ncbi:MAG: vWA domain-containing protein [Myxococcota bacterium]
MSFGFPWGLLALGALLPLAAAYFLRRRQKPRTVSALFLWRTPHQRAQAGPRLERFTRELSFLLEALAIIAGALFLADVRWGGDLEQRHLVVVVDGSLSLAAHPPAGKPVVERVREAVAAAIAREGASLVTVVESGPYPKVLAGPQARASEALAGLENWRPLGPSHDVMPAVLLGRELAGPGKRLWLFTDGPLPEGTPLPAEVQLVGVGEAVDNVALVSAQRKDEGARVVVTVRVASYAATPRKLPVRFSGENAEREEWVELPAGGNAVVRASLASAGPIEVRLPDDALVEDGRVTLLMSSLAVVPVRLMEGLSSAERSALQRFFDVAEGVASAKPEEKQAGTLSFGPRGVGASVQLGARGALESYVGPFFTQKGHPLLDDVSFGGVVWTAGESPSGLPLVTAGEAVLLSEETDGTVHLNLELSRSNVQRTAAWPVLLSNLMRRARLSVPGLPKRNFLLGEEVPVVTEPGVRYLLDGPGGERPVLGVGAVRLPPLSPPGRYRLLREGKEVDALEVLTLDARESDLRGRGKVERAASIKGELTTRALARQRSLWPLLLLLALLIVDFVLPLPLGEGRGEGSRARRAAAPHPYPLPGGER